MSLVNSRTSEVINNLSRSTALDFFELMKPRVMSLVVFTAFVGMFMAPSKIHPGLCIISLLAISLGAGAAGAMNQFFDRDIDILMKRTQYRPIPTGRIEPSEAMGFASIVAIFSIMILGLSSNWFAALLLAFTIFFYVVIYSLILKRKTPQNIVIGGAAGSFPPVIGWVAMTGEIAFIPLFLFAIIFFWTPPHFWSLALIKTEEYRKAKIPMMPNVTGDYSTRIQILIYTFLVFAISLMPFSMGIFGKVYFFSAFCLGILFLINSILMCFFPRKFKESWLFIYSIFYLFSIFLFLILDKVFMG